DNTIIYLGLRGLVYGLQYKINTKKITTHTKIISSSILKDETLKLLRSETVAAVQVDPTACHAKLAVVEASLCGLGTVLEKERDTATELFSLMPDVHVKDADSQINTHEKKSNN
ncbi:hypothetical protein ACJX0J_027368, partial [Zea mays]